MCVYKYIEFLWRVIQLAFIVQVCFDAEAMPTEYALKYEKEWKQNDIWNYSQSLYEKER